MQHHHSLGDIIQTRRAFYGSLFPSGEKIAGLEIPSSFFTFLVTDNHFKKTKQPN